MSDYRHTRGGLILDIREALSEEGYAAVGTESTDRRFPFRFLVEPGERLAAAQALAGDRYEINEKLADWERELLDQQIRIDPADVKVGDVVEVEGDDWMVRGKVVDAVSHLLYIPLAGLNASVPIDHATVRLVRRAEPEPDPEQIEKLTDILTSIVTEDDDPRQLAHALMRRGVTVGGSS